MVNDDSALYMLEIRWELHIIGTYFLPIYKGSVRAKFPFCHLLKWPPKQNLPRSGRRSWTCSAFGASISLVRLCDVCTAQPRFHLCCYGVVYLRGSKGRLHYATWWLQGHSVTKCPILRCLAVAQQKYNQDSSMV